MYIINLIKRGIAVYSRSQVFLAFINLCFVVGLMGVNIITMLGIKPCALCNIQRMICFSGAVLSGIGLLFYAINSKSKICRVFLILTCLTIVISYGFSWYQIGVEKGYFALPSVCKQSNLEAIKSGDLFLIKNSSPAVLCDRPQYIAHLSIAEWTLIGTTLLFAAMSKFLAFRIYQMYSKK